MLVQNRIWQMWEAGVVVVIILKNNGFWDQPG